LVRTLPCHRSYSTPPGDSTRTRNMTGDSSPRARRKTNHRSVLSQHLQARSVNALPTVLTTSFFSHSAPALASPLKSCMSRSFRAVDGRFGLRGSRSEKRLQKLKTPPGNVGEFRTGHKRHQASTSSTCPKQLRAMTDCLIGDRSFAIYSASRAGVAQW
jgi:hypothetical protein